MPRRRTVLIAIAALVLTAAAAALAAAPYLPRLLVEGYPQPRWPAPGAYAEVAGDPLAEPFPATGAIDDRSRALFEQAEGAALLAYQGGAVRLAYYAPDTDPETRFNSYSLAKGLIGALMLSAVADGKIASLDDPIGRYLPDVGDEAFRAVPLIAFLRMQSGVALEAGEAKALSGPEVKDFEAFRVNPFGPMARLHMSGVGAVADGLTSDPTRRGAYSYQNVNTALLGEALARVYGRPLHALLSEKIWRPAGAAPAEWRLYATGAAATPYCCLFATASDWLRVGLFLMRNGSPEAPFLPDDLWREYFGADLPPEARRDGAYGLHVYHNVLDRDGEALQGRFTYLFGSRGQVVYMMPERDLVVARFGGKIQLLHSTLYAASHAIGFAAQDR